MRLRFVLAALASVALAACSDSTNVTSLFKVVGDTLTVYAVTGTDPILPTAINLVTHQAVRADYNSNFDIAFDIRPDTGAVILPASAVGSVGRSGLQLSTEAYDAVLSAPTTGYDERAVLPVQTGQTVLARSAAFACLANGESSQYIYAKLVIDSVRTADRAIFLRITSDPDCGFRSLKPGDYPTF
jgi:hypothetical protein